MKKNNEPSRNYPVKSKIIINAGILLAVIFWLIELVEHVFMLPHGGLREFFEHLNSAVLLEVFLPTLFLGTIVAFGIHSRLLLSKIIKNEGQIRKARNEWENTFDSIAAPIFIHDRDFKIIRCNKAYQEITGFSFQEIINRPYFEVFPRGNGPCSACRGAIEKPGVSLEEEFIIPDTGRIFRVKPYSVWDEDGHYLQSIHLLEDITDRRSLEDNQKKLTSIVESTTDFVAVTGADGQLLYLNNAGSRMIGLCDDDVRNSNLSSFYPEWDLCALKNRVLSGAFREGAWSAELRLRHIEGYEIPVLQTVMCHKDNNGGVKFFSVIARDITAQKLSEEKIKTQLRHLEALRSIDISITSSLDLRVTLGVILDQITACMNADAVDILLIDKAMCLEYGAGRGFNTAALQKTNLRLGEGYAGKAAMEGRLIYIRDLQEDGSEFLRSPYIADEGFASYCGIPLTAKGTIKGVLEIFFRKQMELSEEIKSFVEALALQAAIAIDNAALFSDLYRSNLELSLAYDTTIEGWARALDLRDNETEGHSRRVMEMAVRLARELGLSEDKLVNVRRGALLHDIGKMGIPDSILLKPDKLTDKEWETMRRHTVYGYELLSPIRHLSNALEIPYCHHEKWDGTGYPRRLKGKDIPLAARIFSVVDVWDALCSDRPYRPAWPEKKVQEHIKSLSGSDFDPEVVQAFLKMKCGLEAESRQAIA